MDVAPPANSRDRPRSAIHAEQGKPVMSPEAASVSQGTPLVLRVKDAGECEMPFCNGADRG